MITDILGGKTGAADAASSAKQAVAGRKGADAPSGGFSDALSNYDRDASPQSDDVVDDEATPSSAEDRVDVNSRSSRPKPIIDIRPESLLRPQGKTETAAEVQEQAEIRQGRHMTPAEKKLRDALMAAKAVARKSDELHEKNAEASKKVQEGEADSVDTSILAADDAKIADVLSLLTSGEAVPADMSGMMPKNAAGASARRDRGSENQGREADSLSVSDPKRFSLLGGTGPDPLAMPADPEAAVPDTQNFRFTNARNENQSVDMAIDGRAGERVTAEFKPSSNGGAENVTILDSRRFLGLAPNSNGASLTALISGDSEWAAAMQPSSALSNAAAQSSTGTVVNMLKLQMNPHDLGSVTATLRLHGEELNVHLTVETRAAYRQLSEDSGGIMDALRAQGFSVDQVTISIAPTADSDGAGNQPQGQSGQAGQQGAAQDGRQGFAAGRGQEQADGRQKADQGARTANDSVSDNTQQPGSGNARPGQLYL
ncbi:flagellar hook-length control protein FliK [Rhizobium terrae]|uniref:flagellar hook-length control protein FliK n=1 Tax=Rhizobium terrae TaxID=2171756 RepID=UPI000E3EDC85|nr:flagellar hook-length control protein FliK [Rhizobium terrae]